MGTVSDIKLIRTDLLTLLIKKLPQRDIAPLGYYKNSRLGRARKYIFSLRGTQAPPAWALQLKAGGQAPQPGQITIIIPPRFAGRGGISSRQLSHSAPPGYHR